MDRRAAATDKRGFVGHFDAYGQFVSDTPGGIRLTNAKGFAGGPASLIDARVRALLELHRGPVHR